MTQAQPTPNLPPKAQDKKSGSKSWIFIALLFLIIIIALLVWFLPQKSEFSALLDEKEEQRVELQKELDDLILQHEEIKLQYGELADSLSVKDSIIVANAKEIQQLLNYKWEYRKVNKKLGLLRKISQGYVHQIDSLYTENRVLKEENEKIREQYAREQDKSRTLVKDKEELIEKVTQAAIIKAYNVVAKGVRFTGSGRERDTDKAKKIERVKVCFTLGENNLVEPGTKTIYIRILRPDNVVVTQKIGETYTFEYQGQQLEYTSKKEVDYQNKDTDMCMFWTKKTKDPAMVGIYNISVYYEGTEIGKAGFELK